MRHVSTWTLSLALAAIPTAAFAGAGHRHDDDTSFSIYSQGEPATCADLRIEAKRRAVARAEEQLAAPGHVALEVPAPSRGGVVVTGWTGRDFQILACKAALGQDLEQATRRLAEIAVALRGDALDARGPADEGWLVYFIIRAPQDAALNLAVRNGPLSVHDASGRFTIAGANGPVSLADVAGTISVELRNGPVAIANGGGYIRVRAENGPIAVSLDGEDWRGEGLDARAVNGPLSLSLGPNYTGGVRIESSGHAPWSCGGPCARGERTWDDRGRSLEIGPQPARVRLATVNGPVSIQD